MYLCNVAVVTSRALLLAALLLPLISFAQTMEDNVIDKMCKSMTTVILDELKVEIGKHAHLPAIDDIVYFTPTINFNALADTDYQKIYISRAMCQELFRLADASAIVRQAFPEKILQVNVYAKYLAQQSLLALEKSKPGEVTIVDFLRFTEWAKLDLSKVTADANAQAISMRNVFLHDSLLMIIGHELGHLINKDKHESLSKYAELQHAAEKQMARWREASADKIALRITQPFVLMDGNPASLNALFGLLNRSHAILITDQDNTHPPTVCRISYVMLKSEFFRELSKAKIPPNVRHEMNAFIQHEASTRGIVIRDIAELETLQKQLLGSEPCIDYWDSPFKIFSSAKKAVNISAFKQALNDKTETAPIIVAGLLTEVARWEDIKDISLPASFVSCNSGPLSTSLALTSGSQRFAMQCRSHQERLTPKPIFDAINAGRTFLAKYVDPDDASVKLILVYGVMMKYAGIPRMEAVYYVDLDSYLANKMDSRALFTDGSSGVDIGISR